MWAQVTYISYELDLESFLGKSKLKKAKTINDAADVFLDYYERPAGSKLSNRDGDPKREGRRQFAQQYYNSFKTSGG